MLKISNFFLVLFIFSCSNHETKSIRLPEDSLGNLKVEAAPKLLYDSTNTLENKIQTLELDYIVFGCACPPWITVSDLKKYENTNKLEEHCIFIEPADTTLNSADNIMPLEDYIKVTGQFYKREGYPKGTYEGEEHLDSARVFCYSKITILKHKK